MATIVQPRVYVPPGHSGSVVTVKPRFDNFIGGRWVAPITGQYSDNLSPATGAPFTQVPRSTAEDIEVALDALHRASTRGDADRNAGGFTKGIAAQIDDRHAVDLRGPGSHCIDQDGIVVDQFLKPLLNEVRAELAFGDGLVHIVGRPAVYWREQEAGEATMLRSWR